MSNLRLPKHARGTLEAQARAAYPVESCGLLLGRWQAGTTEVVYTRQARNLEHAHDRYRLDPAAFLAADAEARRAGLEIVGIWHSHPDHPAVPSEADRAAAWAGWSYVILAVGPDGVTDVRSWRLDGVRFAAEEMES